MNIRKGILKSFNDTNYTATIQLSGSYKAYLEDVPVARNIGTAEMITGRKAAIVFFNENDVKDAVMVSVYD